MTALNFPANPSNGDVYENYQYDGTDGVWKRLPSSSLGINGLADVTITTPADGESLVYDNATGEWINADATVEVYGVDTAATDYFMIPVGGDSDRPVTPANGHIRFNTDSGEPEYYSESEGTWFLFRQEANTEFSVEYLVIAGGGGGGSWSGGGGGAGGYRCNVSGENSGGGAAAESALLLSLGTYALTVGAGGAGAPIQSRGTSGGNSVFSTITSTGGGGGGGGNSTATNPFTGGSGGGGQGITSSAGASETPDQGFAGGNGVSGTAGGGGGGAGGVGANAPSTENGGNGGAGVSSSITGSSVGRAGGGGGGGGSSAGSGTAGGGNGSTSVAGSAGTVNKGGGGGATRESVYTGGTGGSGVVILKIPSSVSASFTVGLTEANGGSGQTVGDYKVYTVTAGTGTVTFA